MTDRTTPVADAPVLACLLGEDDVGRDEQGARARLIFGHADRVEEVADGYAFRLPAPDGLLDTLTAYLAFERRCCPFITFELDFAPNQGPLWFRLRGPEPFAAFLREGFLTQLGIDIAAAVRQP
jgi:hypothetical protein